MERIKFNGYKNAVYKKIADFGLNNTCDAEQIITFLQHNKELLSSEEKIETTIEMPKSSPGVMNFTIMKENLYINLKTSTILMDALMLDIHITKGLAQLLIMMTGINGRTIATFSEESGEKCVIKETLRTKNKIGHPNLLTEFQGECCNYNLNCKYRSDDKCCCTPDKIKEIFDELVSRNIFKKDGDFYKYQW